MEIEINGINCYFEQEGSGRDVLLLHGWGCSVELWRPVFAHLKQKCRVTAIDFPGHGKSGFPPEQGYSVSDYKAFTKAFIKEAGIEGCDIIAHSFGARVSIKLANEDPELVGKLLFTGGAGIRNKRTARYYVRTYLYKFLKGLTHILPGGAKLRERLRGKFGSADYKALASDGMRATFNKVVSEDLSPYLSGIKAETLLVWGSEDKEAPLWMGQQMEQKIKGSALVVLEGATHYAYLERIDQFLRIVDAFLFEG